MILYGTGHRQTWISHNLFLSGNPWQIVTLTGEDQAEGTDCPAELILYGDRGQSQPLVIGDKDDFRFNRGATDTFNVYVYFCHSFFLYIRQHLLRGLLAGGLHLEATVHKVYGKRIKSEVIGCLGVIS